jgi:hypothetical protein
MENEQVILRSCSVIEDSNFGSGGKFNQTSRTTAGTSQVHILERPLFFPPLFARVRISH